MTGAPEDGSQPTPPDAQSDAHASQRLGLAAAFGAYISWGVLPAYLKLLETASPYEVVSHRILWAVPVCALILSLRKQWGEAITALRDFKVLRALAMCGVLIAANWLVYIFSVINDRILEASLGYYINPLMFVAAGVFLLGEKLTRTQTIAMALATAGVFVLVVDTGVIPWTALFLAVTFTAYGLLRKRTPVGAVPGLFIETLALSAPAAAGIAYLTHKGDFDFGVSGLGFTLLLIFSGPVTVLPLTLFAIAARRISLATIGFIQYLGPTLSMLLALSFGETFTLAHGVCFGLIWIALGLISREALRNNRPA